MGAVFGPTTLVMLILHSMMLLRVTIARTAVAVQWAHQSLKLPGVLVIIACMSVAIYIIV